MITYGGVFWVGKAFGEQKSTMCLYIVSRSCKVAESESSDPESVCGTGYLDKSDNVTLAV